jgi:TorA maturation chaperone TorD
MDDKTTLKTFTHSVDISSFRSTFYLFFSSVFATEATLKTLDNVDQILALLKQVPELIDPQINPDLAAGYHGLIAFKENVSTKDKLLQTLARHYAKLFLGVGGKKTIFLCESSYFGDSNSLFQAPYFSVKELYNSINLQKKADFKEPDDHLALELTFMAKVSGTTKATETIANDDIYCLNHQKNFIDEHLRRWVPKLTNQLNEIAPESFYTACALMLNGFLQIDAELVDQLIQAKS